MSDRAAGDEVVLGTITWDSNSDMSGASAAVRTVALEDRASADVVLNAGQ